MTNDLTTVRVRVLTVRDRETQEQVNYLHEEDVAKFIMEIAYTEETDVRERLKQAVVNLRGGK